jgi:hypothetical protein
VGDSEEGDADFPGENASTQYKDLYLLFDSVGVDLRVKGFRRSQVMCRNHVRGEASHPVLEMGNDISLSSPPSPRMPVTDLRGEEENPEGIDPYRESLHTCPILLTAGVSCDLRGVLP